MTKILTVSILLSFCTVLSLCQYLLADCHLIGNLNDNLNSSILNGNGSDVTFRLSNIAESEKYVAFILMSFL